MFSLLLFSFKCGNFFLFFFSDDSNLDKNGKIINPVDINFNGFGIDDPDAPRNDENIFNPLFTPGLQLERLTRLGEQTFNSPLKFFSLFFTEALIVSLCNFTNQFAWTYIFEKPSYALPDGSWREVDTVEMMQLLGLIIFMGAFHTHSLSEFWSTSSAFAPPAAIKNIISRTRFKALMCFLQVTDHDRQDPNDKLAKVRSFLNCMKVSCQSLYQPFEHVSVDERMVRSKHRSGMRQYIKDKPVRFGFKLWVIADSTNGYTYDFDVYTGRHETAYKLGLGYDVVMRLCQNLYNQGYYIFFDNFYSSPRLVKDLWQKGLKACGTITENRIGFPKIFKIKKKIPLKKKPTAKSKNKKQKYVKKTWGQLAARGDVRWVREDGLLFLQWKDKKVVTMISNIHAGGGFSKAKRRVKPKDTEEWTTIEVNRPDVIDTYNQFMSGVDRSDQLIARDKVLMKCVKWWKVLFFHCIDIAVVNSYILFQIWRNQHPDIPELKRPTLYNLINFREELLLQLLGLSVPFGKKEPPPASPPPPKQFTHLPEFVEKAKNCTRCYLTDRVEKKTFMKCNSCVHTHLCIVKGRNCFMDWHTAKYDEQRNKRNGV